MKRNQLYYYRKLFLITFIIFFASLIIAFFIIEKPANARDIESLVQYKYFHLVKIDKGDNLWNLANESGYGDCKEEFVDEVKAINNLDNVELIIENQTLVIPYYSYEFIL